MDQETKHSKSLAVKPVGVEKVGETPSLTGESVAEAHGILECTQTYLGISICKGTICFWEAGEVTESEARAERGALFPL